MKDNEEVGQSELLEAPEGAQPPTGSGRLERSASQHFTDLITTLGSTAPPTAKQGRLLGLMVVVIHSQPQDWEVLPSDQWLAVSHRSVLGLQLTVVVSASQAQAQLSLACNEQLLGTEAGIAVGAEASSCLCPMTAWSPGCRNPSGDSCIGSRGSACATTHGSTSRA